MTQSLRIHIGNCAASTSIFLMSMVMVFYRKKNTPDHLPVRASKIKASYAEPSRLLMSMKMENLVWKSFPLRWLNTLHQTTIKIDIQNYGDLSLTDLC